MRARSRHPELGCATPHLLATALAVGDDDPGKVDTGDHRQRRAQQARDVGDVQRVDRGCVYLYEGLVRVGLRHCFGTNCQRLRRRTALLDYDRVHLRDACGGHSGLLSSRWLAYGVAPSDAAWASVCWRLLARVPIVAAAMMARSTNPPAARNAAWKPSVSAWSVG